MKKSLMLCVLLIIVSIQFTDVSYTNISNEELFNKVIQCTCSKVKRCGVKVVFDYNGNGEKMCNIISKGLNTIYGSYVQSYKDGIVYCIDYKNNNLEGYIENVDYGNKSTITINIEKSTSKNELYVIEDSILKSINKKQKDIKTYNYLQVSLPNSNIMKNNEIVLNLLKQNGAINVSTTKIDNGISTVAYTGSLKPIYSNGKIEDLNYSINKYSSGTMLTIGTPVIVASY